MEPWAHRSTDEELLPKRKVASGPEAQVPARACTGKPEDGAAAGRRGPQPGRSAYRSEVQRRPSMRARAVRTDQPTTPTRHGGSKRLLRVRRGRVQPARAASQTSSRRGLWPRRPVSSIASEDLVVEHDPRRRPHTARCASSMPISAVRSTDVFDELYRRAPRLSRRLFGRHGGQVSRPRRALLLGGSAYGGWTCGLAKPEVDAPSGWRVRRTSREPHLPVRSSKDTGRPAVSPQPDRFVQLIMRILAISGF